MKILNSLAPSTTNQIEYFKHLTKACLIPVYFGGHPILALTAICDCGLAAWLGHDGFQWPGSSNYFHMLHHSYGCIPRNYRPCIIYQRLKIGPASVSSHVSHFDCNYGNQQIPWDWVFGSYASKPADLKKIWGRDKPSGPEDDTTKKHASSLSKFMVQ